MSSQRYFFMCVSVFLVALFVANIGSYYYQTALGQATMNTSTALCIIAGIGAFVSAINWATK